MNCLSDTWVCFCTIVLMTGNLVQASEDNSRDAMAANYDHDDEVAMGTGLDMLRLGKRADMKMLRLGKRFLADALSDDAIMYPPDSVPLSNARFFFPPAPNRGPYRRSFPVDAA